MKLEARYDNKKLKYGDSYDDYDLFEERKKKEGLWPVNFALTTLLLNNY